MAPEIITLIYEIKKTLSMRFKYYNQVNANFSRDEFASTHIKSILYTENICKKKNQEILVSPKEQSDSDKPAHNPYRKSSKRNKTCPNNKSTQASIQLRSTQQHFRRPLRNMQPITVYVYIAYIHTDTQIGMCTRDGSRAAYENIYIYAGGSR